MGRREKRRANRANKKVSKSNNSIDRVGSNYIKKDFIPAMSVATNFFSSTQQVGVANALVAFTVSPWFRTVVTKIAQHFSAVSWVLLSNKEAKGTIKNYKNLSLDRRLLYRKELEILPSTKIMDIFNRPNAQMTGRAIRELMMIWYDISGESALLKKSLLGGLNLAALWPIAPQWISELPSDEHPYFVITKNAKRVDIPQEDMIFWKQLNPLDPYSRGSGLGTTMGDELELDETISKYQTNTFKNGAQPSQIINFKGGIKKETAERMKVDFENMHRGVWNAGRTFFATGDIELHQLSQTFAELELTQQRTWLRNQFIHLYGVPPELLGISEDSNRATSVEAKTTMAEEVIIPRLESFKEIMQQQLIDPINPNWILDYEDPRPFNRKSQIDYMSAKPEASSMREWRDVLNLEDRGEVDDYHLIPDGMTAVHINDLGTIVSTQNSSDNNEDNDNNNDDKKKKGLKKKIKIIKGTSFEDDALEALRPERLIQATSEIHADELQAWTLAASSSLGGLDVSLDILNPLLAKYFDDYNNITLKGINETTRKYLAASLNEGIALGESSLELSRRVKEELLVSKNRALMIARTEVNRAANYGTYESMRMSGVVTKKQWVATIGDRRTRDVHLSLHGQVQELNAPFESRGHKAQYPGAFGEASQDINCRCTTVAVIEDDIKSVEELNTIWKTYDENLLSWEDKLEVAFKRGFDIQWEDIEKATAKWI